MSKISILDHNCREHRFKQNGIFWVLIDDDLAFVRNCQKFPDISKA